MPDPQKDLAPIIQPAAPHVQAEHNGSAIPIVAMLLALTLLVWGLWLWRRAAPRRTLRRLRTVGNTTEAVRRLAAWARAQSRPLPDAWQQQLERLRFDRPGEGDKVKLDRLLLEAEAWLRRR
jgi:hypothetical protein